MSDAAAPIRPEAAVSQAGAIQQIFRDHTWLFLYVAAYTGAALFAASVAGLSEWMSLSLYSVGVLKLFFMWLVGFALCYPLYVMIFVRPDRLVAFMRHDLTTNYLTVERLLPALIMLALIPTFTSVFTSLKIMIPVVNPYSWDPIFYEWDQWLHGGVDPWRLLHPLLGYPIVTSVINALYNGWLFVLFSILFWQAFSTRDALLRLQFFLTFLVTWSLLGGLTATWLASGGPCFYGQITGLEDPYVPLMDYLRSANEVFPVWALHVQDLLWAAHQNEVVDRGRGISAMPSMHVSSVVLFALLGWRINRVLGWGLTLFAIAIFLGSIHLAWHYAIDGYVSLVGTWLAWWGIGRLLRRSRRFGAQAARPAVA